MLFGRIIAAILSAATLVLAGLLGARLFNPRAGLLAAMAVAVAPLHVVHSRYLKEDAFLVFFIMCALLGMAAAMGPRREGKGRLAWLLLAGAGAGMAAATKYVAIIMPLILLMALYRHGRLRRGEWFAVVAAILAAVRDRHAATYHGWADGTPPSLPGGRSRCGTLQQDLALHS